MTGRWTHMDGSSAAVRSTRVRGACLAVAVLCALGVLCGVVLRSDGHGHHRHSISSAAVTVADGQSSTARGDLAAITTPTTSTTTLALSSVRAGRASEPAHQSELHVVRTRGPPAIAA